MHLYVYCLSHSHAVYVIQHPMMDEGQRVPHLVYGVLNVVIVDNLRDSKRLFVSSTASSASISTWGLALLPSSDRVIDCDSDVEF
jgi:hypothetical protein